VHRPPRHGLGQDAAAATHVEHALALERGELVDPLQAQGVDLVQWPELALRIPPAVGEITEFGQFLGVDVVHAGDGSEAPSNKSWARKSPA
jgi:hypothetical protein